ncbi:MAG: DUF3160 domain-containing protein [Euryarchaeota archaeon]|nr:DUF3160 domain-containing protein [Euryarchaeota archaeon]
MLNHFISRRAFKVWFAIAIALVSMAGLFLGGGAALAEDASRYELPLSTEDIDNFEDFNSKLPLSEASLERLEMNGFVVMKDPFSPNREDITAPYKLLKRLEVPIFVTSDTLLHVYHIQFDETLMEIEEEHFYGDLWTISEMMLSKSEADYRASSGEAKEAAKMNVAFFSVALSLLSPTADQLCPGSGRECDERSYEGGYPYFKPEELEERRFLVPALVKEEVDAELALIEGQSGFAKSPIFGYDEDYSQYRARGHYTRSERLKNYFKAMIWYGRMGFLLKGCDGGCIVSEEEAKVHTLAASMIARNLLGDPESKELWDRIYNVTSFYVGYSDDLGPREYSDTIDSLFDEDVSARALSDSDLALLRAELARKRSPKIYGGTGVDSPACAAEPPFSPEEADLCLAATSGLRFMGQRFVPDSYIFQNLVIPKVGGYFGEGDAFTLGPYGRHFPRGLDLMAILGSERADEILKALNDSSYQNYSSQKAELRLEFDIFSEEEWQKNLYWSWLYSMMPLLEAPDPNSPAFMETTAWQDKELTTALASWAELRHDTILYAKQSYTLKAISLPPEEPEPVAGYVEPVPEVYGRLLDLARMNREGLEEAGLLDDSSRSRLVSFETILSRLEEISRKELDGEELTEEDVEFINDFGERLNGAVEGVDDESKKTTIVADVHTDPNTGLVLEEGVGYVRLVAVAYDLPGGRVLLAAGPVFSYYEFKQPMDDRLTDEAWREMLADSPPAEPEWAASSAEWLSYSILEAPPDERDVAEAGEVEEKLVEEEEIKAVSGQGAEIRLEDFEVRIGWNLLRGWYADCTITLRNSGDAEGTANVILEDGDGKLLKELEIKVPSNSAVTEKAEVDISGGSREVNSKLVE